MSADRSTDKASISLSDEERALGFLAAHYDEHDRHNVAVRALAEALADVRRETIEACARGCDEFEAEQASYVGTPSETSTDLPMAHAARMIAKKLRQQAGHRTGEERSKGDDHG